MRTVILALTPAGAAFAQRLQQAQPQGETVIWLSARAAQDSDFQPARTFAQVGPALREAFGAYEAVVAVMAAGIVVRSLAPVLQDKMRDPAVVVFDERGQHGISLLAGHLGGANALTRALCAAVGADPVLTTATDTAALLAPDAVAAQLALRPWPKARIQACNAALLAGADITYDLAADLPHQAFYQQALTALGLTVQPQGTMPTGGTTQNWRVCLTAASPEQAAKHTLYLLPRALWAGVGCRKGVRAAEIESALAAACARIGRDVSWLTGLASTTFKAQETGLRQAAQQLGLPLHFYDNAMLGAVIARYDLSCSPFVQQTIGIGNVCEAAALTAVGGQGRLALPKTKFEKVTVALVWQR